MELTDTHTHLYLDAFDEDRKIVIENAIERGVINLLLPNIDSTSIAPMLALAEQYPQNCFPMIGLHPTSVKNNYREELQIIENKLDQGKFFGIGETGIDLYWDKTYLEEQKQAFKRQIELAIAYELPIVIHQRDSYDQVMTVLRHTNIEGLKGVFHCFSGNITQAKEILNLGFKLGIGGILTFKNSRLHEVVAQIKLQDMILETDAPFLAPHPYRGKRNESAYAYLIAKKLADIKNMDVTEIARITTENANQLFKFKN